MFAALTFCRLRPLGSVCRNYVQMETHLLGGGGGGGGGAIFLTFQGKKGTNCIHVRSQILVTGVLML
jgi:hypothetical protein